VTLFTLRPANPAREPGGFCRDHGEQPRKAFQKVQSFQGNPEEDASNLQIRAQDRRQNAPALTRQGGAAGRQGRPIAPLSPGKNRLER